MNDSTEQRKPRLRAASLALPLIVLVVSVVVAYVVLHSRPTAPRAPAKARQARLVTVAPAQAAPPTLTLNVHGTVEAADSTTLRPRVSGQIMTLKDKLAPGTRFKKGETLARIDDADYKLALASAQTDLAGAKASLRVEQGQQAVAKRELALVGSDVSAGERDLALRGPQLEQAKGEVAAAETAVEQAKLDLERTRVRAPFDGIVTARDASIGDVVATSDTLATLAATDVYWVDVSVPVDQLRWLHTASDQAPGSPAAIHYPEAWGDDAALNAEVMQIQPSLETDGRMARVLLQVPDPLGADRPDGPRLLIGAYVGAGVKADIPDDSVTVDSAVLHENDQVWVLTDRDTLDIRSVDVVYRDASQAVVTAGLAPGDAVVTSELTAPIQGMPLRVETAQTAPQPAGDTEATAQKRQSDNTHRGYALDLRLTPRIRPEVATSDKTGEPRS